MIPRTVKKRIDYAALHSTGDVVLKDSEDQDSDINTSEVIREETTKEVATSSRGGTMSDSEEDGKKDIPINDEGVNVKKEVDTQRCAAVNTLLGQVEAIDDDVTDFIDENPVGEVPSAVEDLDKVIKRMEDLRSGYRSKHKELRIHLGQEYGRELRTTYDNTLDIVKAYIKAAQVRKKELRGNEDSVKSKALEVKDEKLGFLRREIKRVMTELENVFVDDKIIKQESDEDILKRKNEQSDQMKKVDILSKNISQIIDLGEKATEMRTTKDRYDKLLVSRDRYVTDLANEEKSREIVKQKKFNQTSL